MPSLSDILRSQPISSDEFNKQLQKTKDMAAVKPYFDPHNLASMMVGSVPVGVAQQVADKTLGTAADALEQKALGIRKTEPGLGKLLTDMGIRGTKEGMKEKIAQQLAEKGAELENAVRSIPGDISSENVAQGIRSIAEKYATRGGQIPEEAQPLVNKIMESASSIAERGEQSPLEALDLKRVAQRLGYSLKTGEPIGKLTSQLAAKEALGYGDELANAYAQRVGGENIVKSGNEALAALLKGQRALSKAPAPSFNILDSALSKTLSTPLVQSYGAKAADIGSKVLGAAGGLGEKWALGLGQNKAKQSNEAWTPEDEQEYNQLKEAARRLAGEQQVK